MEQLPQRRPSYIFLRGQYDQKGAQVQCGAPAILPPLGPASAGPADRLSLARWLVAREHPLTARVIANRLWQRFFVHGLVRTPDDFGVQGERPTHPALLDWLATELSSSGWDLKALQKKIVMSSTYRQSSSLIGQEALEAEDPEVRLLWRMPPRRLSAEEIRDGLLFVSGLLVEKAGGPGVFPYQPPGLWLEQNDRPGFSQAYVQGEGEALYRRSIYSYHKRSIPPPAMTLFDAPLRYAAEVSRRSSQTPLQALLMLNDPQVIEACRKLAERLSEVPAKEEAMSGAFLMMTARAPTGRELGLLDGLYQRALERFMQDPTGASEESQRLVTRRLIERGVRFVQLYHRGWDLHDSLRAQLPALCQDTDQPTAGLLLDLEQRGLLEDTLVIWGGEFGRTPYSQGGLQGDYGRDHHPHCYSVWLAGAGVRAGTSYGQTDDFSFNVVEAPVHVHDLHATILHLLGIDHTRLTYRHQGRDFRLTDVTGHVVEGLLS